ncbi:MAG: hypothetical protein OSB41_04165 [Kiritimatiellae bacterium]|nr:hypothetical protein [Kiritimatiellia bacterium]
MKRHEQRNPAQTIEAKGDHLVIGITNAHRQGQQGEPTDQTGKQHIGHDASCTNASG